MTTHLESAQDLAVLFGARQADIMRLLWTHGPATVREIHTWLRPKANLAYTTIMTLCVALAEKGLLERHEIEVRSQSRARKAYLYTPRQSEAEFVRTAIERRIAPVLARYPVLVHAQITGTPPPPERTGSSDRAQVEHVLAYVATLCDAQGQAADAAALATIAALLERAERAEREVVDKDGDVRHAEARAAAAERRAERAERRVEWLERQLETAHRQLNRPPKQERKKPVFADSFEEHRRSCHARMSCVSVARKAAAWRRGDGTAMRSSAAIMRASAR